MNVHVNGREVEMNGRYVREGLRDSTDVRADPAELRRRLDGDGFVLLRDVFDRRDVLAARESILATLEGVSPRSRYYVDWKNPKVKEITESNPIRDVFTDVLGGEVVTYDYKWLRTVGRGYHTGLHWDCIYWESGEVYSAWIPLGDIPIEQGGLAVLCGAEDFVEEAKLAPRKLEESYKFWGTIDPFDIMDRTGGRLEITDYRAGDIVIFSMFTPHCTLKNQTDTIRTSVDVRYQLATEPLDMNYMGENPAHVKVILDILPDLEGRDDLVGT